MLDALMPVKTVRSRLLQVYRNFLSSRDGNVAIIFAITLIPVLGMVGAAVDFSHANSVKVAMQAALDATALKLSKEAATDTSAQLQTNATNYFKAMFNRPEAQNVTITATYTSSGGTHITVNSSAAVPTYLMGIMGFNSMTVTDTATATWGSSRLLVSLVLDNTGSMSQSGKITAEQTASKNLLTQLQAAAKSNGDVYVSIIPFVEAVNVGSTNRTASWLTWGDYGTCGSSGGGGGGGGGGQSGDITQRLCSLGGGSWTAYSLSQRSNWTGCVADRGDVTGPDVGNYDTNAAAPTLGNYATEFPSVQYSSCPQQSMGLSYNWSAMTTLVNNMSPAGLTNQNIGLAMGWMSLVGGGPYSVPSLDPNYTYKKFIILLTDGLNNTDHWYNTQAPVDARQTLTCSNIKAAGITIYTVQISTDGTPLSTLLQNCATDSTKFFYLTSANEIITTFNSIGTDLSNLYLSN
jgi:Flp pilus assembly protein TadG